MITADCVERVLPVVADSWEQLRGCDVYRLLDSFAYLEEDKTHDMPGLRQAAEVIAKRRTDLANHVQEAVDDLCEDSP